MPSSPLRLHTRLQTGAFFQYDDMLLLTNRMDRFNRILKPLYDYATLLKLETQFRAHMISGILKICFRFGNEATNEG